MPWLVNQLNGGPAQCDVMLKRYSICNQRHHHIFLTLLFPWQFSFRIQYVWLYQCTL